MLKLMYITNDAMIAKAAESAGVDRVFIDLETLNKKERQFGRNTFITTHVAEDVKLIRSVIDKSELLVRVNPVNINSKDEIDKVVSYGADIIMLPMFKTANEVKDFISIVDGRCRTMLLIEHKDAVENLDDILKVKGIDEFHIGLNDLHISMGKKFMFELIADGTVDKIMKKVKEKGYPIGFGGVSRLGTGLLPADIILAEHYRLGSNGVILSRGFTEGMDFDNEKCVRKHFYDNIFAIREKEKSFNIHDESFFSLMHNKLVESVKSIINREERS